MILADMHIHSSFSDGKLNIPQIVDLYGSLGFGAIGITDLLYDTSSLQGKAALYLGKTLTAAKFPLYAGILKSESERAWDQYQMILIPGIEFVQGSTRLIGLGVSEYHSSDTELLKLTQSIHHHGGITVAGQPLNERFLGEIDAWEVTKGGSKFNEIILQSKLPKIAGSGFRSTRQLSSWKTVFDEEKNPQAILEAIRKQNLSFRYFNEVNYARIHHLSNVHALDFSDLYRNLRHSYFA